MAPKIHIHEVIRGYKNKWIIAPLVIVSMRLAIIIFYSLWFKKFMGDPRGKQ